MTTSITGMMKVFYQNKLLTESFTMTVSSGDSVKENMYDLDRTTAWYSNGSDDLTTETIEVEFGTGQYINRLLLVGMNFKNFGIQYDNGGWSDFSNVYSAITDSAASSIAYTTNSQTSRYFEFDQVYTTKIKITIDTTIVADEEKELTEFYIGSEIGTFIEDLAGNPNTYIPYPKSFGAIIHFQSNGGAKRISKSDKYRAGTNLKEILESNDQTIIQTILEEGEFAIYPCGAVNNYTNEIGWRLQDFYHVVTDSDLSGVFSVGRDKTIGLDQDINIYEQ